MPYPSPAPGTCRSPAPETGRSPGLPGLIGRACYRRRWLTLFTWIAGVACLITLWTRFGAAADNNFTGSDPGQAVLSQHFPRASGDTLTLAIRSSADITSRAVKDRVTGALAPFERAPHVTSVSDPYQVAGHVWLAAGHGPADHHGAPGHRRRPVADRAARPPVPCAVVLPDHCRPDRPGSRRRLCANCQRPPSCVPVPDVPMLSPTRRARDGSPGVPPNWRYVAL